MDIKKKLSQTCFGIAVAVALILILTLGIGILIGYLAGLPSSLKKGSQLRQVKRDLGALEETNVSLSPPPEEDLEGEI